jgi:two-component system response regulator DegU
MKSGTVIIADFNQNMLEGIRGLLDIMFDATVMVADKESLFETTEKLNPNLVIVDLSISVSRETNILQQLKIRFPNIKIIILSVHDDSVVAEKVMNAGGSGFVAKSSAATDLIPAVTAVLNGGKFISPSVEMSNR